MKTLKILPLWAIDLWSGKSPESSWVMFLYSYLLNKARCVAEVLKFPNVFIFVIYGLSSFTDIPVLDFGTTSTPDFKAWSDLLFNVVTDGIFTHWQYKNPSTSLTFSSCFFFCLKKLEHISSFCGATNTPGFWTSGNVSSQFQSQSINHSGLASFFFFIFLIVKE